MENIKYLEKLLGKEDSSNQNIQKENKVVQEKKNDIVLDVKNKEQTVLNKKIRKDSKSRSRSRERQAEKSK